MIGIVVHVSTQGVSVDLALCTEVHVELPVLLPSLQLANNLGLAVGAEVGLTEVLDEAAEYTSLASRHILAEHLHSTASKESTRMSTFHCTIIILYMFDIAPNAYLCM